MKKYQLITIPDWLGSANKSGVELGPKELEEFILSSKLRNKFANETFNVIIPEPNPIHLKGEYEKIKYLPEIKQMCSEAKEKIIQVINSDKIPIVLMANDSSMIGVLSGISSKIGNDYSVIWFDAHGDINTPTTSPSGKIYGMPLAHLLGFWHSELIALNGNKPSLKIENVIMIGQRSLDKGEIDFIGKNNITIYNPEQINSQLAKDLVNDIYSKFKLHNVEGLFIHIDLDVLDPKESPGVTMQELDGLSTIKLLELVSLLTQKTQNSLGLSIAEYNPKKDINNKTKNIAYEILKTYMENNS